MGAGRGSNRVSPVVDAAPDVQNLAGVQQDAQISSVPFGPFQYRLEVLSTNFQLTNAFQNYVDGGAESVFRFPLGCTRGGLRFIYTSGEAGGQLDLRVRWGIPGVVDIDALLVANTKSFAPTGEPSSVEVPLSLPIFQTPPATAGAESIRGLLPFWVPPGVFSPFNGGSGLLSIQVRDQAATTPGVLSIEGFFFENYGTSQPAFHIQ